MITDLMNPSTEFQTKINSTDRSGSGSGSGSGPKYEYEYESESEKKSSLIIPQPKDLRRKVYLFKNKTVPQDPYHDLFKTKGFDPIFVPLLRHEFINTQELGEYLESSPHFQNKKVAIIITSQRAIEALNEHLPRLSLKSKSILLKKPIYTVGPASAAALKKHGYTDIRGGENAGNGQLLAEIILKEQQENQKADRDTDRNRDINGSGDNNNDKQLVDYFVFFTGVTRRDIIPTMLRNANIKIEERVVYKTMAIQNMIDHINDYICDNKGQQQQLEIIKGEEEEENPKKRIITTTTTVTPYYVFFSPAEADPVVEAVRSLSQKQSVRIAAIGPTTESYLLDKGMKPRVVASKPDAIHLVKEIIDDISQ